MPSSSSLKLSNGAVGRLAASLLTDGTSVTLRPGDGALFPSLTAGQWFPATIIKEDGTLEIVKVTARATDVLTVVRAQEGTAATSFVAGDRFEHRMTAGSLMSEIGRINDDINTYIPVGGIIMFTGADPGVHWAICDGRTVAKTDGTGNITTPDLRDRFIVGAGTTYAIGNTGGANTVALTEAQMPAHNHSGNTGNQSNDHSHSGTTGGHSADHTHYFSAGTSVNGGHTHVYRETVAVGTPWQIEDGNSMHLEEHDRTTSYAGDHNHSVAGWTGGTNSNHTHGFTTGGVSANHTHTIPSAGSGQAHENRPPYYALAFIMKV